MHVDHRRWAHVGGEKIATFADVSLPVPLDQPFTYALPESMRHRAQAGSRVLVPFGTRKLTGVILKLHDTPPEMKAREAIRLLDEEAVLSPGMISLARWISNYYCCPLGEVLRTMTPLTGEVRRKRVYSLTDAGRDSARQLTISDNSDDPQVALLRMLEARPMAESSLAAKIKDASRVLRLLEKKGFVMLDEELQDKDPLRAPAARLRAGFLGRAETEKLKKPERELIAFLELHPGTHNLAKLEDMVPNAGTVARGLARRKLILLEVESPKMLTFAPRGSHQLNPNQQVAFEAIRDSLHRGVFEPFLLQGVTGSGKTEVYLSAIEAALAVGRSALLLVPEIALTPAVAGQFFHRFGDSVAILHSAFSDTERADQWRRIRRGEAKVVVGTRSGIFAPVQNLGLILVDEEHDQSYKQEENPRYNGRDVAVVRAKADNATIVLGSATPSLETRQNAEKGKYQRLLLPDRVAGRPMPQVEIVDMRQEYLETKKYNVFSRRIMQALTDRLALKEQAMLLMNRRGFASFVACRSCGERVNCVNCAVTLTYHRRDKRLLCHYCNYAEKVPTVCPLCQSEHIQFLGTGAEKVEDELHQAFPAAQIARMDRDTVASKRQFETLLYGFREGAYDILVGTQMIAKGHDIPKVTFVGIVNGDIGLGMPDFRAAERTFQLLTQAAGRAGRGDLAGKVLIQTINPDHYAIQLAATQDYEAFYEKEIQFRKAMRYPPFAALANLMIRHQKQEEALRLSSELAHFLGNSAADLKILGPAEAAVARVKNEFRYQLLLKAADRRRLNEKLQGARNFAFEKQWPATALIIDVDPLSLL